MKKVISISAVALVALSLTACSDPSGGTVEKSGADNASQSQAAKDSTTSAAPEAGSESSDPKLGDAYTWENGMKIAVSKPKKFKPSEYAMADVQGKPQVFTVTVTNGTEEDFKPVILSLSASSGGSEAEQIFDSSQGVEMPTTTVKPGKTVTYKVAFDVEDPDDITMDVSPGFEYDSKTFVS
ncbi:DUF1942 domain-containing protein [Galactobacter caseinivorans]|uniref:DUF1942 domain-containing protein n=1 Tax=Galactobacter caseinivorans TaxID=2676123 RepID=A0A496PMG1_9MICC|nr:DUF1942 domain-containing protein [Galactobacter caseinivorans]RKW71731.1 DUF1942 domain-containing protein [Galactobacter caseinivorans]